MTRRRVWPASAKEVYRQELAPGCDVVVCRSGDLCILTIDGSPTEDFNTSNTGGKRLTGLPVPMFTSAVPAKLSSGEFITIAAEDNGTLSTWSDGGATTVKAGTTINCVIPYFTT